MKTEMRKSNSIFDLDYIRTISPIIIFLVVGTISGLAHFLKPPLFTFDSDLHLYRICQISIGDLVPKNVNGVSKNSLLGGVLPQQCVDMVKTLIAAYSKDGSFSYQDALRNILSKDPRLGWGLGKFIHFPSSANYSPVSYLPQASGMTLGRLLGLNVWGSYYLAMFFALLAYLVLMGISIRIIPIGKWALLLVAVSPLFINQAISVSADGITNGVSILFFSYILQLKFSPRKIANQDLLILLFFSILLSLVKPIHIIYLLLYFLIPQNKFSKNTIYLPFFGLLLACSILCYYAWFSLFDGSSAFSYFYPGVNPDEQLRWVVENPFIYLKILWGTICFDSKMNLWAIFTNYHLATHNLSFIFLTNQRVEVFLYLSIFLAATLNFNSPVEWSNRDRLVVLVTLVAIPFFTYTLLYIGFNDFQANFIWGMQGRYLFVNYIVFTIYLGSSFGCVSKRFEYFKYFVVLTSLICFLSFNLITSLGLLR